MALKMNLYLVTPEKSNEEGMVVCATTPFAACMTHPDGDKSWNGSAWEPTCCKWHAPNELIVKKIGETNIYHPSDVIFFKKKPC